MNLNDIIKIFENKCDNYINQCNKMYCYLIEPILLNNIIKNNNSDLIEIPKPTFWIEKNKNIDKLDEYFYQK